MDSEIIYHYVYRITNIKFNKHYYGSRSCKISPYKDIGIEYFSSSKDKVFKEDQIINPQDYIYKVVFICQSREQALEKEIKLHNKFDVGINPNFYNRARQSRNGFITNGKVSVKDSRGNFFTVSKDDPRYISGELVGVTKGMILVEGEDDIPFYISKDDPKYISGEIKPMKRGWAKPGKKFSEEHKRKLSEASKGVPKSEEHRENIRKNRPCFKGKNHPRSKYLYVTPLGTFDSPAALEPIIPLSKMKNFCINCDRLISYFVYKNCQWMKEKFPDYEKYIKGKTYREIGFYTK